MLPWVTATGLVGQLENTTTVVRLWWCATFKLVCCATFHSQCTTLSQKCTGNATSFLRSRGWADLIIQLSLTPSSNSHNVCLTALHVAGQHTALTVRQVTKPKERSNVDIFGTGGAHGGIHHSRRPGSKAYNFSHSLLTVPQQDGERKQGSKKRMEGRHFRTLPRFSKYTCSQWDNRSGMQLELQKKQAQICHR